LGTEELDFVCIDNALGSGGVSVGQLFPGMNEALGSIPGTGKKKKKKKKSHYHIMISSCEFPLCIKEGTVSSLFVPCHDSSESLFFPYFHKHLT
jgi:hypothetical protein